MLLTLTCLLLEGKEEDVLWRAAEATVAAGDQN